MNTLKNIQVNMRRVEGQLDLEKQNFKNSQEEFDKAKKNLQFSQTQIEKLKQELSDLKSKLEVKTKTIEISEHALLRYIERILGLDVESVKQDIMNSLGVKTLINGKFPIGKNDGIAVVKDNVVVTIEN